MLNNVVVEAALVVAAGRWYASSRAPVLARPRRGNVDLPDVDAPDHSSSAPPAPSDREHGSDRWVLPSSFGMAVAVGGSLVAPAAMLVI